MHDLLPGEPAETRAIHPRRFRYIIEDDLARGVAIAAAHGAFDETLVRLGTPYGEYCLAGPAGALDRHDLRSALRTFCRSTDAYGLTFVSWRGDLGGVYALGIHLDGARHCVRRPKRGSRSSFGDIEWLPGSDIDAELRGLPPQRPIDPCEAEIAQCLRLFGPGGAYPAVKIGEQTQMLDWDRV